MALAIDASSPALATVTGTQTTVTTASFTPPAGSQLWAGSVANMTSTGGTFSVASTPTLGAFTQQVLTNTQEAPAAWHYANVVTSQSYTVTSTRAGGGAATNGFALYVVVVTGQETTPGGATATNNSNSGLPSQTIATTRSGSLILANVGDWSQSGLGTAGTSQTILAESNLAGQYTSHYWRYNGFPTVATYTINLTAPSAEDYNLSVVEIRPVLAEPPAPRRGIPRAILNR